LISSPEEVVDEEGRDLMGERDGGGRIDGDGAGERNEGRVGGGGGGEGSDGKDDDATSIGFGCFDVVFPTAFFFWATAGRFDFEVGEVGDDVGTGAGGGDGGAVDEGREEEKGAGMERGGGGGVVWDSKISVDAAAFSSSFTCKASLMSF